VCREEFDAPISQAQVPADAQFDTLLEGCEYWHSVPNWREVFVLQPRAQLHIWGWTVAASSAATRIKMRRQIGEFSPASASAKTSVQGACGAGMHVWVQCTCEQSHIQSPEANQRLGANAAELGVAYRGSEDHRIKPTMEGGERLAVLVPVVVLGVEYEAITAGAICAGKAVDQVARGISFGEDRLLVGTVGSAARYHFRHTVSVLRTCRLS